MRIGELAKAAGVHVQTIRFYERRGLLPSPSRSSGGYRDYRGDVVPLVQFIKQVQARAVVNEQSMLTREGGLGEKRPKHVCNERSVNEHDRATRAGVFVRERQAIEDCPTHGTIPSRRASSVPNEM